MSGITGIFNRDGSPLDRMLLQQMTGRMAYRGPDAQEFWSSGQIGFGHAMLRTTEESLRERQPCSLDGEVWITADARVDGRRELIRKLGPAFRSELEDATDPQLILHAYREWAEDCVLHVLGDFSFAIWDGPRKRLFCARDPMGVKPFYYSLSGDTVLFSNTFDSLKAHPQVSCEVNEQAIADFLLTGLNQELGTTGLRDVLALPPAHTLTADARGLRIRRYWNLPVGTETHFRRAGDYLERFDELLVMAVEDRLRTRKVGIFMSGGIDSPMVAATAKAVMARSGTPYDLRAFSAVYDHLIPDEERRYAHSAAASLDIPIHFMAADGYLPFQTAGRVPPPAANPGDNIFAAKHF
nr:asparagine synthetase B [Gemmatimonadota bacterium]